MSQVSQTISPFMEAASLESRRLPRPTPRQWALHAALLVVTAMTTTICGISFAQPDIGSGAESVGATGWMGLLLLIPRSYVLAVVGLVSFLLSPPLFLCP